MELYLCCYLKVTLRSAIVYHIHQNQCWLLVLWIILSGTIHVTVLTLWHCHSRLTLWLQIQGLVSDYARRAVMHAL